MIGLAPLALLLLAEGARLFDAGRFPEAEHALRAELAKRPTDGQARLYLARTLIELNRVPEALLEIGRVTEGRPGAEELYQTGAILRRMAERRLAGLERAAPASPAMLHLTGQQLERQGNREAALEKYRAAARLEPERRGVHYAIGNLLWRARDFDGAARELELELRGNPRHGLALFRLGQILAALGQDADAARRFESAAQALPGDTGIRRELGKAYRKTGRLSEARSVWEAIARERPADDQVHFLLGGLYREMGEEGRSQASFRKHRDLLERRRALSERR